MLPTMGRFRKGVSVQTHTVVTESTIACVTNGAGMEQPVSNRSVCEEIGHVRDDSWSRGNIGATKSAN
jgi:hypothetical protein